MIPQEQLPQHDFTVDEVVELLHCDRQEAIKTLHHLDAQGKGTFTIGRRGGKSRWSWAKTNPPSVSTKPDFIAFPVREVIAPSTSQIIPLPSQPFFSDEQLKTLAHLIGLKEKPSFETICGKLDVLMNELYGLRQNVIVEEPPDVVHVERKFLEGDQWTFWDWNLRKAIAQELLAYRRGK